MKVAFLFDESNDWIFGFFKSHKFKLDGYSMSFLFDEDRVTDFDVVFLLGYTRILPKDFLQRNKLTLVVHESDLPKGKGFAPIQWQILEGCSEIKISLIETDESVDSGDIFLQSKIIFDGTELYEEIREKQAKATIDIVYEFLKSYPNIVRNKQVGKESFYPKRTLADGELNISKTIEENFNLLRIGNNDDWPSFFYYRDKKYVLKIFKSE
jgi:methionyl-tRNA formyltransferase